VAAAPASDRGEPSSHMGRIWVGDGHTGTHGKKLHHCRSNGSNRFSLRFRQGRADGVSKALLPDKRNITIEIRIRTVLRVRINAACCVNLNSLVPPTSLICHEYLILLKR